MLERSSSARWNGALKDGDGTMRLGSGAFEGRYSFSSRFEEGTGTNPEELIAAAHAGCFSMALAGVLGKAGFDPKRISTTGTAYLEKGSEGFGITRIRLETEAEVPDIDEATFRQHAEDAKKNCPVSKALAGTEIQLEARLAS